MRVVFHYDTGPALARRLAEVAGDGLDIAACPAADDAQFGKLMEEADVLWHVLRPVSAADIEAAPRLRLIQKIGVGVNTIDLEAARTRDIRVCNMPGTNTRAVAEMTLTLMLAALRRLPAYGRAMREGNGWAMESAMQDRLGEIGGRAVGLVGFGAVPQALAPVLKALGARMLYTARAPREEADGLAEWRTLPALLEESDIVSLHVPETPETIGMIDAAALARMKPGAVLVNTARGSLVDEAALSRGAFERPPRRGRARRLRPRAGGARQPAARPRQRGARPACRLANHGHHRAQPGGGARQLPAPRRRAGFALPGGLRRDRNLAWKSASSSGPTRRS